MIQARYSVIQYIPDLIRNEATNLGILIQTPSHLTFRLLREYDYLRERGVSKADINMLEELEELLTEQLSKRTQKIYDFVKGREITVENTDPRFLDYLGHLYDRQIQFTPGAACFLLRDVLAEAETLLDSLFNTMVEPVHLARPKKVLVRVQPLRAVLRRAFRPLVALNLMEENYRLRGSVEHVIDFSYSNERRVLIETLPFNVRREEEILKRANACVVKWLDIAQTLEGGKKLFKKSTVLSPPVKPSRAYEQSLALLERYSDVVINFSDQGEEFIDQVYADLGHPGERH